MKTIDRLYSKLPKVFFEMKELMMNQRTLIPFKELSAIESEMKEINTKFGEIWLANIKYEDQVREVVQNIEELRKKYPKLSSFESIAEFTAQLIDLGEIINILQQKDSLIKLNAEYVEYEKVETYFFGASFEDATQLKEFLAKFFNIINQYDGSIICGCSMAFISKLNFQKEICNGQIDGQISLQMPKASNLREKIRAEVRPLMKYLTESASQEYCDKKFESFLFYPICIGALNDEMSHNLEKILKIIMNNLIRVNLLMKSNNNSNISLR